MPAATLKFTANPQIGSGKGSPDAMTVTYFGSVSFSAATDTYATGGIAPLAGFGFPALGPYADRTPLIVSMFSQAGSGFNYQYNIATNKVQIFAGGGSGTAAPSEITNGTALNATTPSIFSEVINFSAVFPRH